MHKLASTIALGSALAATALTATLAGQPTAEACGCFAPPDPSVPIVQAGERIAFALEDGKVKAHIQVQYSGAAEEFGWLLPLPSLPTLEVGTDELFVQLISTTQPVYRLTAEYVGDCPFNPFGNGGGGAGPASDSDDGGSENPGDTGGGYNPLVIRDSVGPYDYAVLRADEKQPMLDWLDANGFFVPAGTDDAVDGYIRPGAYFLALKLLKGNDVGDIQPVVVEYESDLPMIPIVLTGVAADPDMPVMVWVLGDSRAIPRNFYHTELNDADIDWLSFGANYIDVINDAVDEADGHHSFITEYAGSSSIMADILDYQGRFGDLDQLKGLSDAVEFVEYLTYNGYTTGGNTPPLFTPVYTSQTLGILQGALPVPAGLLEDLVANGGSANDYYLNIRYYLETDRLSRPDLYEGLDTEFDPIALGDELEQRVVTPTIEAGQMFRDHPYLTRMFTTLSPDEMTRDPAFSFNPDLEDVSNVHDGRLIYYCGFIAEDTPTTTPATLITEDGWELPMPNGTGENPWTDVVWPESLQIAVVREEGDPEIEVDNTDVIAAIIEAQSGESDGCSTTGGAGGLGLALGGLGALLLLGRRRRRA
ncbi:MAG TPA: DUF2330 domain-containing protein [Kofleriaceae bacterium]|nr:DUF2330 domain-containing protein [Kofleriaceae bacterium]